MPVYLFYLTSYSFWINLSWYRPDFKYVANFIKSDWIKYMTIIEAMGYFLTAIKNVFEIFGVEFLICDPIMWRFWVFHIINFMLPNFELVDSNQDPSVKQNE